MKQKRRKHVALIGVILTIIVLLFFPVKFSVEINDVTTERGTYFIVKQQSTTGPNWKVVANNGEWLPSSEQYSVLIEGVDPSKVLNDSVQIDSVNLYVLYGNIKMHKDFFGESYPVIQSNDFDILYPIERGYSLRAFVSKEYLTLLDYSWRTDGGQMEDRWGRTDGDVHFPSHFTK